MNRRTASQYLQWAKSRKAATFNLAASGVAPCVSSDLNFFQDDIEINAPGSYGYKPLVYRVDGEDRAAMVNHLLTAHLGGSLNLWNRLRVSLNAPIVLYTEGQEGVLGTRILAPPSSATTLGDIRLGVDGRIAGLRERCAERRRRDRTDRWLTGPNYSGLKPTA